MRCWGCPVADRRKFPSLDDPTRFDAIVGRGRALRRRRQLGVGAGAGGGVAAVALAVVMVTGSGGAGDRLQHDIVADDDKVEALIAAAKKGCFIEQTLGRQNTIRHRMRTAQGWRDV